MERILALALHLKKGYGFKKFQKLKENYGSLEEAVREGVLNLDLSTAEREIEEASKKGFRIVTIVDEDYPQSFFMAPQPPLAFYLWGNFLPFPKVAVIGSRRCSDYGRRTAFRLGKFLSEREISVVSGLALGIDSAAHRGALKGKGKTIAVLGSSLDCLYPSSNRRLAEEIVESGGGIISEFPLGTRAKREFFPRRNRLIAALSEAVVVVEARERSGTFITVNYALEMGKEVFAVPGNIDSPFSRGANRLIVEGATPLVDFEEFLSFLPLKEVKKSGPSEFEQIYSLLKEAPLTADEIAYIISEDIGFVSRALSQLEISGHVKREGAKWVAL